MQSERRSLSAHQAAKPRAVGVKRIAMSEINVQLNDSRPVQVPSPTTVAEALKKLDRDLAKQALAARVNGREVDLAYPIQAPENGDAVRIEPVLPQTRDGLDVLRHSTAHLLAAAVLDLFPGTKLGIGPALLDDPRYGFFYDVIAPRPLTEADLPVIEKKMRDIAKRNMPYRRDEISKEEALRIFAERDEPLKCELIDEKAGQTVSVYYIDGSPFIDFCLGPHEQNYGDSMFAPTTLEETEFRLKPMNCPFHIGIYKSQQRSYRDLPQRYGEMGTVYRAELSGTLHGLMRVRGFTVDDAHLFCTPEQDRKEIGDCLDFVTEVFRTFGFEKVKFELSVKGSDTSKQWLGSDEDWSHAESALAEALDSRGVPYERIEGEAAFYGPKVDIKIEDAIGRLWQLGTVQGDFNLPK